jgi:hypothetical protein
MNIRGIGLWLVLCLTCTLIPNVLAAQVANDNPSVTAQLDQTKMTVAKIKKDAAKMQSFTRGKLDWQSHRVVLETIKADVNKLQENMRGLQSHRTEASPWQQDAIDRITGLANDLATNMNNAIDQLNKSKSTPTAPPYPEYLDANYQIVSDLQATINSTIDFAQTKAKMDVLQAQLPG